LLSNKIVMPTNAYQVDGGVPQTGVVTTADPYHDQIALTEGVRRSGEVAEKIVAEGNKFRAAHPFLFTHQDAIGMTLFIVSIANILMASWWVYELGFSRCRETTTAQHGVDVINTINSSTLRTLNDDTASIAPPAIACGFYGNGSFDYRLIIAVVVWNAFWMSILHELEHDLIHFMYFRKQPFLHNLMMLGICVFRPNSSSGWIRRRMHLHHHRVSGTPSDFEERTITNGYPWGVQRFIMTGDHVLSWMLRVREMRDVQRRFLHAQPDLKTPSQRRWVGVANMMSLFPLGNLFYASLHAYTIWITVRVIVTCAVFTGAVSPARHVSPSTMISAVLFPALHPTSTAYYLDWMLQYAAIVLYLPSLVRVFSLQFVSSNMHYYGDVEPGNVIQQTQVWTSLWVLPFHLFCFNFGGTHAIHHFVARETFYVRQLTAWRMYPILKAYGVRFNDFASLSRANRREPSAPSQPNTHGGGSSKQ
jgi:hypothetical protein